MTGMEAFTHGLDGGPLACHGDEGPPAAWIPGPSLAMAEGVQSLAAAWMVAPLACRGDEGQPSPAAWMPGPSLAMAEGVQSLAAAWMVAPSLAMVTKGG
jgi:hypothetical protein